MKKTVLFIIAIFACLTMWAQGMYWTPVDEGLYSSSTTVIAVVQIDGVEQTSDQIELAVFSGDECRGTAMTGEFPFTHRFLAQVNVYGENGHLLTFKAYDHRTQHELELEQEVNVLFTEDGSGTLFAPLELDFFDPNQPIVMHWTPVYEGLYSSSTTVIAVVQIDGVEQTSDQIELAVFSGDECRGTALTGEFPFTHRFLAQVNVYGETGHLLTFKAYDHHKRLELEMEPIVTVTFTENGSGTLLAPLELNFASTNVTTVTQATTLVGGAWNRFGLSIEVEDPVAMLQALQEQLGDAGLLIETPNGANENFGDGFWFGDLDEIGISNEEMIFIQMSEDVGEITIELEGLPANPANHPIAIVHEAWTRIGFPCSVAVPFEEALAGFEAVEGDIIEGPVGSIEYYEGIGWFSDGEFLEFIPGEGYLFYAANATVDRTLVFICPARKK